MSSIPEIPVIVYGGSYGLRERVIKDMLARISKRYSVISVSGNERSVGISVIKDMIAQSAHTSLDATLKIFILNNSERLTYQAQNALLKLLEEPPASSRFILELPTYETLLSTIVSRSQLLSVKSEEDLDVTQLPRFEEISAYTIHQLFELAEKYSETSESIKHFIGYLILISKERLRARITDLQQERCVLYIDFLLENLEIYKSTPINGRLLLENCVLGFNSVFKKN